MTTFFQPGGPQAGGSSFGPTAEPQQYYPAAGYPAAGYPAAGQATPAPQVDYHHPYPAYQPEQAAWSQPQQAPMPQPYQPPTWGVPVPAAPHRNKAGALFIAVTLLLVAGAVTLIVVLTKGDNAGPVGPQAPQPSAPVVSAPTSAGPVQPPQPFPSGPAVETTDAPPVPAQTVPAQSVPAQTTPAQTTPDQTTPDQTTPDQPAGVPGQQEAEQAAGGFVDALRSADFAGAATYICSAQAASFAAGAAQLSTKVQLETLSLSGVRITGSSAEMTMTYQAVGQTQSLSEYLPMTVEAGSWKICN